MLPYHTWRDIWKISVCLLVTLGSLKIAFLVYVFFFILVRYESKTYLDKEKKLAHKTIFPDYPMLLTQILGDFLKDYTKAYILSTSTSFVRNVERCSQQKNIKP